MESVLAESSNDSPNSVLPYRCADLTVDTLIELGASHAFNVIGIGMFDLGDAFYQKRGKIRYVSHVNETNLALMAQGYARTTRAPTFCFVYYSSGTALAMASLTSAWADRAPLVLVSATSSRLASGRDAYAAVPRSILEMGAQYSKWSYEVPTGERLAEALARAYTIASTPPMGPVHLAIPADLFALPAPPLEARARTDFARTRAFVESCANEAGLAAAADMLVSAKSPLLLAGSEIGQLGGVDAMVALAEALGAPVLLENMPSYLSFPTNHPQYVGMFKANGDLRANADAVLSVGVEYTEIGMPWETLQIPASTPMASLSVDPALNVRHVWPDLALVGHPKPSLARLAELVAARLPVADRDARKAACVPLRERRAAQVAKVRGQDRAASPVAPGLIVEEIRKLCGRDWVIMNSGTTAGDDFDVVFEMDNPDDFHALSGKGSCQGWGGPVSIGVQLAVEGRRVMCLLGDGNLMFTGTSIWAAAKYKLPMVFVVANNGGWAHVPGGMGGAPAGKGSAEMGWTFEEAPIDFVGFARSMGLEAERVETAEALEAMLARAAADSRPWLIEVATARVPFMGPVVAPLPKTEKAA